MDDSAAILPACRCAPSCNALCDEARPRGIPGIDDGEALKKIARLTPSFLAGARGPQGTIWLDEQQNLQQTPAFPVHTVDTLGAGDVFHGAFALAVTERLSLIHISEPTRLGMISYAVFCLK